MEGRIREISRKLDKVIEVNTAQDVHLERLTVLSEQNTRILDEHMRRTEANEERIELVERSIDGHLSFIRGAISLAGVSVTIVGVLAALHKMGLLNF